MNRASRIASTKLLHSVNANGLNHAQSKGVGSGAVPAKKCHRAATTKIARARYWMPSRMFWIRSPISTPRQLTHVIAAMKTTPVAVTSGTLSESSASSEERMIPSIRAQK